MSAPGRRRFASGRTRLVLMALAALFILSVAWWLASAYVEHEHAAVVVQWRARLTAMADDRQRAIEGWIAERQDDTSIIANYLTTQYLVADRRSGPYPFPGDEHRLPRQRQRSRAGVAEGAHRSGHVGTVFVRPSAPARGQLHVQRGAERRGAVGACATCGGSTGLFGRRLGELELWSGRHRPWNADHTIDATPGRQGGGSECGPNLQAGQVI